MMYCDFHTETQGKWILAGEHAVLRGHGALVFPLKTHHLKLSYYAKASKLCIDLSTHSDPILSALALKTLNYGKELLGLNTELTGNFTLKSSLPIGRGLGGSAALCLAISRWFAAQNLLLEDQILLFAQSLENLFHGKSSGLDIIGSSTSTGVYFKQGQTLALKASWQPRWFLSFCGDLSSTATCIAKVLSLWEQDKNFASQIDLDMNTAVDNLRLALEKNSPNSLSLLQAAIRQSATCFQRWGLISAGLERHMQELSKAGALAVKPTGSGGGGYLLSLWDAETELPSSNFIPLSIF